ncbi:hypothetical protein [Evansella cellulosilytica]|nr:hypothetical protein [Evansella cellulosilytica]
MRGGMSVSAYIRDLIRKDMENKGAESLEEIYQYVEKRLKESGLAMEETRGRDMKDIVDEVDKELILNLF